MVGFLGPVKNCQTSPAKNCHLPSRHLALQHPAVCSHQIFEVGFHLMERLDHVAHFFVQLDHLVRTKDWEIDDIKDGDVAVCPTKW